MPLFNYFKNKISQLGSSKNLSSDGVRFILAGLTNTAITLIVYQFALLFFQYRAAYSISWIVGLGIAVIFYPSKVFIGSRNNFSSKVSIAIIYLIVFSSGFLLIDCLTAWGLSAKLGIFVVIAFTTILNFLLMRLFLRKLLNSSL